jgi:hypothetical protein
MIARRRLVIRLALERVYGVIASAGRCPPRGCTEVTRTARTRTAAAPWSFTLPRTAERLYNTP